MSSHSSKDKSMMRACHLFPAIVMSDDSSGAPSECNANNPNALYELVMVIGGGATGVVFLARNLRAAPRDPKFVAVKFVELCGKNEGDRSRALAEVHCLVNCSFFAVLRCHNDFIDRSSDGQENAIALVLDYANAGDLRQEIKSRSKTNRLFKEHEAGLLFLQVLMAIHYLHSKNMLHRDIKSANVLLSTTGIVKLGDFGFSKMYAGSVSTPVGGTFCGTPYYVAPEIWQKIRYSNKADMYSLGVLLFELLTLKRPFDGEDLTRVRDDAINAPVPELPEGVSPEMSKLVDSLMAKDPEQRPDAGDVLALPIMKLLTSALLEVAHSSQVDIPESEREQIIADVERVRRQMRPPRPVPRVLQPQLMSIAPSSSLSVSASPNMTTGSSFPEQVSDDCIFMESMVWKGSGDGNWKRRYLSLIRNSASGQVELLLSVAKSALGSQCIRKSITDFDDVFAVPTRYTNPPLPFSFALMTSNGKKLAFRAESQEDLDAWISHISYMLHQVSLPVTSSSQTFPEQSGKKSELE